MECIILAGGLGTRLKSVVNAVPKCMAPIANQPFLYHLLVYLKRFNVKHVILAVGYKHEIIKHWVNEKEWPFLISYTTEMQPLGTGGAIKLALQKVKSQSAIILNGDTYFDIDLISLYQYHTKNNSKLTIALKAMANIERYGTVGINDNQEIVCFEEKKKCEVGLINGGIYILNKFCNTLWPSFDRFSFEEEVLQTRFKEGNFKGVVYDDYFIDIGIPSDYEKAELYFSKYKGIISQV